jgi:hypothetical protein
MFAVVFLAIGGGGPGSKDYWLVKFTVKEKLVEPKSL